ncbi:MAG: hypothetical protein NTX22_02435 [Ignavibacteriales bacterium]|nr:hypothetical protein [Ignavibacteriales bacterium]
MLNNKLLNILLIILLIISEAVYLSIYSNSYPPIVLFTFISIFNSVIFVVLWLLLRKIEANQILITIIILSGIIFRLSLFPVQPIASDDIYRYIWDGKVMANGINPFRYSPADTALNFLHSETFPAKINHPTMKTIYPPYSQLMFYFGYKLFGENVYGIKILLFIAELLSIFLLYLLLKKLNLPAINLALYSLCPLPIMQFMVDGHVDGTGFPLLLLFFFFYLTGKKVKSYLMIGLSISSKFVSGMILPFVFKDEKGKNKIIVIIVPVLVLIITYILFILNGVFPFESLIQFSSNWIANSSIFTIILEITKNNQNARLISLVLFVICGGFLFFLRKEFLEKVYLIFMLFFLFSPTVHPWYLTWIAILLPLNFRWGGLAFITLVNLANIMLINYVLKGIWETSYWILAIEYLPIIVFFVWEITYRKKERVLV